MTPTSWKEHGPIGGQSKGFEAPGRDGIQQAVASDHVKMSQLSIWLESEFQRKRVFHEAHM